MYQHINTHSLLDANGESNLLVDQALIVQPVQAAIAQECAQTTDLQDVGESCMKHSNGDVSDMHAANVRG